MICGRAMGNSNRTPEELENFKEHLKECDECREMCENLLTHEFLHMFDDLFIF